MASYNELNALIDAYINQNGVQAITGQILNGVLKAMVEQLGRGYTIMGAAIPTTDPGTPDGPECYFASETGTYTDFDGLQVVPGELALLCYTPADGWTKATIYEGFRQVGATIDGNVGTPSVGVSYANGVLSFDFHNMKGNPGQNGQDGQDGAAAGFGTIGADITGGVGTPGVSVESSGPATAKNLQFHFTNLKGETGVTSVVVTVDNTTGTPTCTASLSGGVLTLAFTGLKGAQGNPGSSVDYPFTLVNNLTTDDPDQALTAAMGVQLESEISQLEAKVDGNKFIKIGTGTLPSYYLAGSTLSLSNTGDYVEIDCTYTGTGNTYEDKNFLLTQDTYITRNRLGFSDLSHFTIRVHGSGNTDLSWDISGTIIKERHTYKLVKVATGFELFIDGVSKGTKAYSDDGVFTFNNIGSRASSYSSGIFVGDVYSVKFYNGTITEIDILDTTKMTNVVVETTLSLDEKINDVAERLPKGGINFFSYDSSNKEFFAYVNIPATDKYIGIPVKLQSTRGTINDEIWYRHIWEIDDDDSGVYQYAAGAMTKISQKVLVDGESEFVSQMVTGDPCDYTGGVHGDEAIDIDPSSYAKFFADGVELDITADIPLSPCNEVSYIQRSTIHRTARLYENYKTTVPTSSGTGVLSLTASYTYAIDGVDTGLVANNINSVYTTIEAAISGDNLVVGQQDGFWTLSKVRIVDANHTILAHHLKETVFANRGYTTKNALVFTEDGADYSFFSYHGICCASKIAASVGHNENYVDVTFTGSGQNYLQDTGMRLFQARNATNKMSVEIEAGIEDGGGLFSDGQCSMFVWDRSGDSKYYRKTPNLTPSENSRFASKMNVRWGILIEE